MADVPPPTAMAEFVTWLLHETFGDDVDMRVVVTVTLSTIGIAGFLLAQVCIRGKAAAVVEQSRRKQGAIEVARADAIQRRKAKHQEQEAARLDAPVQDEDPRAEEMGRVLADHLVLYNKEPALVVCLETVRAIISNVLDDPAEPKFRRIKSSKKLLADRVLGLRGGAAFMKAAGFDTGIIDFEEYYLCDEPDEAGLERLGLAVELIDREVVAAGVRVAHKAEKEAARSGGGGVIGRGPVGRTD